MDDTLSTEVYGLLSEAEQCLAEGNTEQASDKIAEAKDKLKTPPPLPGTGSNGAL